MERTSLAVLVQIAERIAQRRRDEAARRGATVTPIRRDITTTEKIA